MSDLISRADALKALDRLCERLEAEIADAKDNPEKYTDNFIVGMEDQVVGVAHAWHELYDIPSAETTGALDEAIAKYVADGLMELPSADAEQTDCTDFVNWLLDEIMDEEMWELNAVANGEIIARKLKKLGLLEVKDGYYIRHIENNTKESDLVYRPSADADSDDLIRRQDAIDAMWKALYAYEDLTEKQFMEHEELELKDWFLHRIFVQRMHEECMKAVEALPYRITEYKTFCGVPIEEAERIVREHNAEPKTGVAEMRRWIKMTRIFLGCLFHVKGYSWFAPWVRDELYREGEDNERSDTQSGTVQ